MAEVHPQDAAKLSAHKRLRDKLRRPSADVSPRVDCLPSSSSSGSPSPSSSGFPVPASSPQLASSATQVKSPKDKDHLNHSAETRSPQAEKRQWRSNLPKSEQEQTDSSPRPFYKAFFFGRNKVAKSPLTPRTDADDEIEHEKSGCKVEVEIDTEDFEQISPNDHRPASILALTIYTDEHKQKLFSDFCQSHPQWMTTLSHEEIIDKEYSRLGDLAYMDYTGATLYPKSLIEQYQQFLLNGIYGNPHSIHEISQNSSKIEEKVREDILNYFGADPKEYTVIFTSNASTAAKLVAESFPFGPKRALAILNDNHNSIVGMREFAWRAKADFIIVNTDSVEGLIPEEDLFDQLGHSLTSKSTKKGTYPGLFCYPAQSNFGTIQHPLEWIESLQRFGWKVLLDASAFVPTNRLDLSKYKPDYITVSWYKLLGFPTGVGCLIAKKMSLYGLTRPWFAAGTVTAVSVYSKHYGHFKHDDYRYWEDGTPNFLTLQAISYGLEYINKIKIETINTRVKCLAHWVLEESAKLEYPNGVKLVQNYGTTNMSKRCGGVTFNIIDWKRRALPYELVDQQAIKYNLCVRAGCFCNPGASERLLGFKSAQFVICLAARSLNGSITAKDIVACATGHALGAVRVSFGVASRWEDAFRLMQFLETFLDIEALKIMFKEYKDQYKPPESLC